MFYFQMMSCETSSVPNSLCCKLLSLHWAFHWNHGKLCVVWRSR